MAQISCINSTTFYYDIGWNPNLPRQKVETYKNGLGLCSLKKLNIHPEDIESRSMGAGGEDLIMARAARQKFPFSIECKNVEKLNVWEAYNQAKENSNNYEPIVVMKKIIRSR